jgi:HAE1 family hydrophobic/amphiphilic exporter-1
MRDTDNNVYTQIGIVLLVGLASKNAILIVEFARAEREQGKSILEAAIGAARLRFRPILMTSIASIFGFLPLVVASGAGAASRQAIGTAVVGGMVAATAMSLLFTPVFYVVMQRLGELRDKKKDPPPEKTAA